MHDIQKYLDTQYHKSGHTRGIPPYVIAVDLDGTLTMDECWTVEACLNAEPNTEFIQLLREKFDNCLIIVWTARKDELIPASLKWLRKHGVPFRAISNLKMGCDLAIDDKTIRPDEISQWEPGWTSDSQPRLIDD